MRSDRALTAVALAVLLLPSAAAADAPDVHALTGVRIVVAPGSVVESGTVVLRDGIIAAAGADVAVPPDARVWDHQGLTVYSGLIEPYAPVAWPEGIEKEDPPQAGHDNPLVRPERDIALYAHSDTLAGKLRQAGFTTAVVSPRDGLFRGQSAVVNLGNGTAGENLLRRSAAQAVAFQTSSDGAYPESLMGAVALFRQTMLDARWYGQAWAAYERNPAQARPALNTALEALQGAVGGEEPIVFVTRDVKDSLRAARHGADLGLRLHLVGNGHEYEWLDEIAATNLPHIVPLAFPEKPTVGESDDLTVSTADLRHWDEAPANPASLVGAGVRVAFTSHDVGEPRKIHTMLARAIERGLSPEQALAGLTTVPAELYGIADRAGTVEVGKMANLVVADGDLFVDQPKIREVWIDGDRFELKDVKPAEVTPVGTWDLEVHTGDGQVLPSRLVVEQTDTGFGGSISAMGATLDLSSVEVSGSTVTITFDGSSLGMPGTFTLDLQIEGDSARGSGDGPPGSFDVKGTRTSSPDTEEVSR